MGSHDDEIDVLSKGAAFERESEMPSFFSVAGANEAGVMSSGSAAMKGIAVTNTVELDYFQQKRNGSASGSPSRDGSGSD